MKRILALCLVSVFLITALVGCAFPNENNEANDDIAKSERNLIDVLEDIAVMRPSLDEFKQIYPDCRVLREDIDGSYSNIIISTSKMPNVLFSFERYFGKNGYSGIYLSSINASASLILPEYVNMSIADILQNEGELAFYKEIQNTDVTYGDVYIYRENFYYYIQGYAHPYKLGEDGMYIKLYDDSLFSPIENKFSDIETNANSIYDRIVIAYS